jgi:hypothetical protein
MKELCIMKLMGRICYKCGQQYFSKNDKYRQSERKYNIHIEKCDGHVVNVIKLEKRSTLFAPFLKGKILECTALSKPYKYPSVFVVNDLETCGVLVNEKFGKKSELTS